MAVEPGDPTSGFRHTDVIQFINSEIRSNGGGPDFYLAFRSQSWNEVEEGLRIMLADRQVPQALKRACTWSALALGVRVVARQQEQQAQLLQRIQEMEEREAACWDLASEMQRMREDRDQAAAQLHLMRASLQRAFSDLEMFRGKLLQAKRLLQAYSLPQEGVPGPGTEQHGAPVWFPDAQKRIEAIPYRAQGTPHLGTQMPDPAAWLYGQGPSSPWAQPVSPPVQMPVPHFPFRGPFPVRCPYFTPLPSSFVMESGEASTTAVEMAAGVPHMPPAEIYPPGSAAAVGSQEVTPRWEQSCHFQDKYPENLQDECHPRDSRNYSPENDPACLQEMPFLGDSCDHIKEQVSEKPQETDALGDNSSYSQKEEVVVPRGTSPLGDPSSHRQNEDSDYPKGMTSLGNSSGHSKEEDSERPQETDTLGYSSSHSQKEELVMSQGTALLGDSSPHSQKKEMVVPQGMAPLEDGGIQGVIQSPKKQQPRLWKAKRPRGKKASQAQPQEKAALRYSPVSWVCSQCEGVNPGRQKTYRKCKKSRKPVESGGVDSRQTH